MEPTPASRQDIPNEDGVSNWRGQHFRYGQPMSDAGSADVLPDTSRAANKRRFGREFYLWFTVAVGLIAVALEKTTHILADIYSDPLPHYGYLAAYLVAILAPLYTRWVLSKTDSEPAETKRMRPHLAAAVTGNIFSLLMAGMMGLALLPISLIALILSIFFGLGLPGLSPYFLLGLAIYQGIQLRQVLRYNNITLPALSWFAAVATGVTTALALFIHPFISGVLLASALRPGQTPAEERAAADALHRFGGDNAVLIECYNTDLPIWESLGVQLGGGTNTSHWDFWNFGRGANRETKQARRIYYLMTGQSYTHAPIPWTISNNRSVQWINDMAAEDVGGTRVGRPAVGMSLASKTGTALVDPRNATGECDFTLRFANASDTANEARAEILLPPGAVCHHASLWINGTERPAAFGPQATVRRAYEEVAVVQRRDPLLVTMPVPGKLLVQCFPVPAKGTMQIRLGVTFPLLPDPSDRRKMTYALPAWGDTNFAGAGTLASALTITDITTKKAPVFPLSLASPAHWSERALARRPVNLVVALDQSSGMNAAFGKAEQTALQEAVTNLPAGSSVSYVGADGKLRSSIDSLLRFQAGQDNAAWLSRLDALRDTSAANSETVVLYLHAGTPDCVSDPAPLAKAIKALPAGKSPRLVSLLLAQGAPDVIGDRLAMQKNARAENVATYPSGAEAIASTVDNIVRGETLPETVNGTASEAGLERRERLRAYRSALGTWYAYNNFGPEALAAARTVARMRLVTPLSGAVVLETQEQYEKHGLDDGSKDGAKSKKSEDTLVAPEPGTWLLMTSGGIGFALYGWRRRAKR